jgi:hypothetical protein
MSAPDLRLVDVVDVTTLPPLDYKALCKDARHFDLGRRDGRPYVLVMFDFDPMYPEKRWMVRREAGDGGLSSFITRFAEQEKALRFGVKELRAMRPLHVFFNAIDCVIAESAEDARDLYCRQFALVPRLGDAKDAGDPGTHAGDWEQLPDDKPFTLSDECIHDHEDAPACEHCENGLVLTTKTCAAWCDDHGEGWFTGQDY